MMKRSLCAFIGTAMLLISTSALADVAGDVRAGISVVRVINNGVGDGLDIETVVTLAINAGADPVEVIKAAIAVRPAAMYRIIHAAARAKPVSAAHIVLASLGISGVIPGTAITAAASAVTNNRTALTEIRDEALGAGVQEAAVDAAIERALGSTDTGSSFWRGRSPGSPSGDSGSGTFGGGGGGGGGNGAVSPSR
jgi:hypothetical protein